MKSDLTNDQLVRINATKLAKKFKQQPLTCKTSVKAGPPMRIRDAD